MSNSSSTITPMDVEQTAPPPSTAGPSAQPLNNEPDEVNASFFQF
jgi:hypothetical protein